MLQSTSGTKAATALSAGLLCTVSMSAFGQTVQQPKQQIDTLQREVERLEKQQQETARETAQEAREAREATAEVSGGDVEFEWAPGPTISTKDGKFAFHVRGRLQADYNYLSGDDGTVDTNTMELRRARLRVDGTAWYHIDYTLEFEFAEDGVDVTDALVEFKHLDPVSFMVGQFKTPNSLDEQTSSRFLTFMERAHFTDAFELDRRLGAAVAVGRSNSQAIAGLFFQNSGVEDEAGPFNNTWGAVAARAHYAIPLGSGDTGFVHLGTSVRYRDCDNGVNDSGACGGDEVRYRQRPFFHGTNRRTVNTDTIDNVESDTFWGPEFGLFYGPLAIKGEGGLLWGSRGNGGSGENRGDFGPLWGAYVDVAYFVTGESQPYDEAEGALDRPEVNTPVFEGGWGAWEVAARLDYLSLEDANSGIEGGEQWTVVGGVNWWLNRWSKLQFNYAHTKVSGGPLTARGDYNVDGFGIRAQVDW